MAATAAGVALMSVGYAAYTRVAVQSYAVPLTADYDCIPLISVGDQLPLTSDPTKTFQFVGIPDGMGARLDNKGNVILFVNHELTNGTQSEPILGAPLVRGAHVSKLIIDPDTGVVLSGDLAFRKTFLDDTLVGDLADTSNATPGFARFCSGSLATKADGFDQAIYFANEESGGASTFDGTGGLSVAVFDGEAHGLTYLGRFAWEQTIVQPRKDDFTVLMCMEDGSSNQDPLLDNSQLYMYVGRKDRSPGATVLERNGLVNGTLYVFRALKATKNSELLFQSGSAEGEWVAIAGANTMSDVQLEAASDAAGAMLFVRPEDGAFNPRNANNYFFVTTGGLAGSNELGRLYSMRLNKLDPTKNATLTIMYNADTIVAAGGDTGLSPDNIDVNDDYLMIQEDGTTQSRAVMTSKGRDGSIWRFALTGTLGVDPNSATRVVELDPPGRDGTPVNPGVWESSGIIEAKGMFGAGDWLIDVQAHSPTKAPAPNTVEDGQILLLKKL